MWIVSSHGVKHKTNKQKLNVSLAGVILLGHVINENSCDIPDYL